MRRLGGIWLAADGRALEPILGKLWLDWLGLSRGELERRLTGRRGSIKAALMNQKLAAGLGNLTADELLWRARIAPRRPVSSLSESDRSTCPRCRATLERVTVGGRTSVDSPREQS